MSIVVIVTKNKSLTTLTDKQAVEKKKNYRLTQKRKKKYSHKQQIHLLKFRI